MSMFGVTCHSQKNRFTIALAVLLAFSDLLVPARKPPEQTKLPSFYCCDEHVEEEKEECLWQLVTTQQGLDASLVKCTEYLCAGNALLDTLHPVSPGAHERCNSSEHIVPFSVMDSFLSLGHSIIESCLFLFSIAVWVGHLIISFEHLHVHPWSSCLEYQVMMRKACKTIPGPHLNGPYIRPWISRAVLTDLTYEAGTLHKHLTTDNCGPIQF